MLARKNVTQSTWLYPERSQVEGPGLARAGGGGVQPRPQSKEAGLAVVPQQLSSVPWAKVLFRRCQLMGAGGGTGSCGWEPQHVWWHCVTVPHTVGMAMAHSPSAIAPHHGLCQALVSPGQEAPCRRWSEPPRHVAPHFTKDS